MTQIKNYDVASVRGERTVADGIADPAALALLKDFDFNDKSSFEWCNVRTVHLVPLTG
ncbi:MAG: hypothetical protein IPJ22_13450 [Bacteroidetes bacterium]|nr:hypothetical protein [Bacteroidota bacterium]